MPLPFWCRKDAIKDIIHHQVKAEHLVPLLHILNDVLPEPTKDNCWHPNSHILCEIRDKFFERLRASKMHRNALNAIWKLLIIMYDHDSPYRDMIDWCKEEVEKYEWQPRKPHTPDIQIWWQDEQLEEKAVKT